MSVMAWNTLSASLQSGTSSPPQQKWYPEHETKILTLSCHYSQVHFDPEVVTVTSRSMGKMDLFKNNSYLIQFLDDIFM